MQNATATTDTAVVVPAVSGTGRPNYVALNGRVHRATCKRRGTYKGGAAPMIGSAPMMARLEGVKPATCCKPEKAADWKAALAGEPVPAPTAERVADFDAALERVAPTLTVVKQEAAIEQAIESPTAESEAAAIAEYRASRQAAEPAPAERTDTTERMVTLTSGGVKVRALYVSRTYRGDAKKPYTGTWVLESNGATIAGGPTIGYTVNGVDAGKGPLGAVAVAAAR